MGFQFTSISDFLTMGGHGPYVWASYGITMCALAYLMVGPWWRHRQLHQQLAKQQRRQRMAESEQSPTADAKSGAPKVASDNAAANAVSKSR